MVVLEHNGYPGNYCQACKPNDREPNDPIFSCWKQPCNFYVHAHCLPKSELPPSVKNIHHLHALNITYSRITDHLDDYSSCEYYCDSCEEKRKLSLPTYYCAGCHFVAHVDCNIAEVINHFKTLGLVKHACQIMEGDDDVKSLVDDVDGEIATESATLARLKAKTHARKVKLDRLKEEINSLVKKLNQLKEKTVEQSAKLDQLKQRRAQLDTSK